SEAGSGDCRRDPRQLPIATVAASNADERRGTFTWYGSSGGERPRPADRGRSWCASLIPAPRVMADFGAVDRDGFTLEWAREGSGPPMMVLGARHFYPRYFSQSLRDHFEIVFCDLRQWVPSPSGFDISTITRDTFSEDIDALRQAVGFDRPIVAGQS